MLQVITPATSTKLTTVNRAREMLGLPSNVSSPTINLLIPQASRVIVEHCRRTFGMETVRETFVCNQIRGDGPLLARSPVVEIVAVQDESGLLSPADYALDSATNRLRRLNAAGFPVPWWWAWGSGLSIDYRAGYTLPTADDEGDLPEPVERACQILVATYLNIRGRDPTVKTESIEGIGSATYWVPGSGNKLMSPEAEQLLVPYIRFYP